MLPQFERGASFDSDVHEQLRISEENLPDQTQSDEGLQEDL